MHHKVLIAAAALLLAGCGPRSGAPDDVEEAYQRAEVVRVCVDGTYVGRDPKTGRLVFGKSAWDRAARGWVAPGIAAADVCAR